jgi:hypothetical protein
MRTPMASLIVLIFASRVIYADISTPPPDMIVSKIVDNAVSGNIDNARKMLSDNSFPIIQIALSDKDNEVNSIVFNHFSDKTKFIGNDTVVSMYSSDKKYFRIVYIHMYKGTYFFTSWYLGIDNGIWKIINVESADESKSINVDSALTAYEYDANPVPFVDSFILHASKNEHAECAHVIKENHISQTDYDEIKAAQSFEELFNDLGGIKEINILYVNKLGSSASRVVIDVVTPKTPLIMIIYIYKSNGTWKFFGGITSSKRSNLYFSTKGKTR